MPTVKLPNGKTAKFPDTMQPEEIQQAIESDPEFAPQPGVPAAPVPKGLTGPSSPNIAGGLLKAGQTAKGIGAGLLKGAGSTANNIGHLLYPDAIAKHLTGAPSAEQQESYFKPSNTTQAVGKGLEQAGEFLLPGGAEESGAAKLAELAPKVGKVLPRLLTAAGGAGLVNKAQGGNFGTGAAAGAAGAGIGAGLKAAAPMVAESALGIPKVARAFGKTPGEAIINETKGIRPETIASSAQQRLGQLNPELNAAVAKSQAPASLLPARTIAASEMGKASQQNAPRLFNQIQAMDSHLGNHFQTGTPIQPSVTPSELLDLKRGFGEEHIHNWNPEISDRAKGVGRQMYHALDSELDRTVPEAQGLNQRISSLIPVARRAESVSRNAPTTQRVLGRFSAHTGALTLGGLGAVEGRREGGIPGMIAGGVTGVLAPELIASPEGQMATARLLNTAKTLRPAVGGLLQTTRGNNQ